MKYTSTPRMFKFCFSLIAFIITSTLFYANSYAQTKNYAQVTPSTGAIAYYSLLGATTQQASANAGSVVNPGNAAAVPSVSPAVLSSNYFNLLNIANAEGEAYIQLKYPAPIAAGKITYIPFDAPTITAGLNLDVLGIVGGLTGLLSTNTVQFDAYTGADAASVGTLVPTAVTSTIVKDASGRTYFAVTSASNYNSIRVKLRYRSNLLGLSLGTTISMNVYTAFNYTADNCGTSIFTNVGEATGLNVSLTSLIANPERAIDGNLTTFSQVQAGLIGLGGTVSQTVYLNGLSGSGDVAKVVLSQPGTLLTLNLLKTVTLQAYNGSTLVGSVQNASNLINLQLLQGTASVPVPVFFTPGAPFDRVKVTVDNGLSVGGNILSGGLNIHEVQRTVTKPTFAGVVGNAMTICGGSNLTLAAQSPNAAFTYNFYKKTGEVTTLVASANAGTYTETALAPGTYTYYVSAQRAGCTGESDLDMVVVTVKPTLVFTTTTLTNGSAGKVYSKQITAATGGTPGYTYSLAAGSTLPAGLTISPAGLITGTPSAAGTFNFDLTATDSFGCIKTASYTLVVTPTLTLPTAVLPVGTVGTAYPATQLPAVTGGSTPYTYAATNLPPGLILNPATGQITGTPTQSGTFTFPVTITDADGYTVSTDFTIIVRDPLVLTPATLSDGTNGVAYPTQIIPPATGGSGVYTYTASGLPAGLSFNPATREVTGTPTQSGTFTFPVNVSDNEGRTATANYTVTIKDRLVLATATLPDGTVGIAYPVQTLPAASGGTGPYIYAATNVPPGLTFDPVTRQISGIPTQSGTFTISVKVTDNAGNTLTVPYTLRVTGTLGLAGATLPNGTVGTAYTAPALPAVTGGTAPYIYAMTGLPAGLNFNPATRVISGTPALGGNFTLTMSVSDNGGLTTSTDYALNIGVDVPAVTGATLCAGGSATLAPSNTTAGVTYNFYSATGNTPLSTGATYNTGALTQTTTFYVEAVSGTAVSARVPVTITVNPTPDLPSVITNNQTISNGQTATLQATAAAGSTIKWYAAATGGVALATGGSFITPALAATTTYYAGTENSSGCTSLTRVPVLVTVIGVVTNPNCNAAATQQSNITGLLCVACNIQDPGNSTDADPANYTQISLTVGVGASGYQRLIFQRPGVATDSIRVDLETPTGLLDLTALGGITLNVMNGNTIVKSYPLNNSLVNLGLLTGNRFKATVLASAPYDRVEVNFSPIVSALTSLRIYGAQVIFPDPTLVSGNQTICSGTIASLNATALGGTTLTWYSAATGGSILASGATYTTDPLTATTVYYIEVSKNGCANPVRVPVTVTVIPAVAAPVLATIPAVCAGSPAVLAVDQPQTGITYKWYTASTGGTAVFTGEVFTTPALTTGTTYYLEAANGNCTAPARVVATVVVNPRPVLPQITASATTVNQGQSVRLTGTSTETGVIFNWYTTADGTTPVFTGPDYVTPPLTATTTFYLDATSSATGCASSARVQQTITVNGNGTPVPVLCETPVNQTNGISGTLSILARVDNPTLAIDGDQQTASTLSIPVGINAAVFQKVNFTGLSNVGDTVRIRLTATNQLLSLSLLSNITLTTFQGATSNNDGTAINNNIINLQLLNGGAEALINLVPTAPFDGVEVRLNSGLLGALSAIDFNYARRITQAPAVTANPVTACLNATATLTVTNPQPGIIYKWYDAAGTYLGNDGATFVTPVITADTQFFVEASRGGCGGSRTAVNVTLIPAPQVPLLLSATEQTCQNANLVLQVQSPQTGVTYQWYNGNTAITGATASSYSITNIQTGGVYSVEAINSCGTASSRATVTVTVGSLTAPTITPLTVTVNSGEQTLLTASSSTADLTYTWYATDPSVPGAVPVSTATNGANGTFVTPPLTVTTTYYVTAQSNAVGGCISPAATVVVTVTPGPTNPGTVPCEPAISQTVRSGGTLSVLANVANPGFAVDDDIETSSSLFIPLGINSFVAQKVDFSGLSLVGDTVRMRLSSTNTPLSLSLASSITVTTYNGNTSNGDETAISSSAFNLQLLPGGQNAIINFVPGQVFDGVELKLNSGVLGALTGINLNYARRIILSPTVTAAAVTVCEGTPATLSVTSPAAGITYKWYLDANLVATTNAYQTPVNLTAGIYNYKVSANRNGCESAKTSVTVTVVGVPPSPVPATGNPVTTCLNTPVTLSVDQSAGVIYNWYDALVGGNLLASNTNAYTTSAMLAVGTTDFYVEALNSNSCGAAGARTKISITINPAATATDLSVAGAGLPFCAGGSAVLTASSTTVTNPVFTWYSDAALTNAVFTGATFNIASVTASTTYYVTVRGDNKCDNTPGNAKAVSLQVNPTAVAADVTITGVPASLCAGSAVTLTASSTTVATPVFTWYSDAALTNAVFTGPVYTTPVLTGNTNFYVTVQGADKCPNLAANAKVVQLTINPTATAADIDVNGVPASVCSGSGTTLTASSMTVINPVFAWYTDAALSNAVFTGAVFNTPSVTANTTYYVTVRGDNKCENVAGAAEVVTLNLNPPIVFNGGALPGALTGFLYFTQINSATGGTPGYTYIVASGSTLPPGLSLSGSGLLSGTPAVAGNYTFAITVTDSRGCNATATFTLNVASVGLLTLPTAILPDGLVGSPYPAQTLPSAVGGTTPYTYIATNIPPGFNFDPVTRELTGIPTLGGTFTMTVTVTDANGFTATTNYVVKVNVPAPVVANAESCNGNSATLTVSNPVTGVSYNWYASASGGNILFTGNPFQTPAISATTVYYAEGVSGGVASTRTPVTVTLKPSATDADIQITGVPSAVCSGSGVTLTASSLTVTNPVFTWYTDIALTNAVFTGAVYPITSLTANTTYYVSVSGDNKCANLSGTGKVAALTVNPPVIFSGTTLSNAVLTVPYLVQLNPATGGTPGYTYTVAGGSTLPAGLSLSPAGELSGTATTTGAYTFDITATDSRGCSATASFTLTVVSGAGMISLPPANLHNGVVGSIYAPQVLPAAIGGTGPYTYIATGIPPGLGFDPVTREITGTPTLGGVFTINVTVTDANGLTAMGSYALVVTVPAPVAQDASGCAGSIVTLTVQNPVANVTYNWYAGPTGGNILGTGISFQAPPLANSITYYAEGASGTAVSTRTPVSINLGATATGADVIISGVPSVVCSGSGLTLTASSITVTNPVFTWYTDAALSSPVFTGAVYPVDPLTASTTYYVTVRGDNKCENTPATARVVVLTVNPAISFNGASLSNAALSTAYSVQLNAATGGTPGYTYSVTSGSTLPGGLSLSSAGVLSGTPVAAGNYTFSVTATDSKGCSAMAVFTLTVGAVPMSLPPATLPDGIVGSPYTPQTLPAVVGGTGPYTYVATGLPPGLNFDPVTRVITGTPTLGGTFTVTVTVTDANGLTATGSYTIVVTVPAPVVPNVSSCGGSSVTLIVQNPVTGVTYNWYAGPAGGSMLTTGTSFQVNTVTANITYYVEGTSGTAVSTRVPVNINLGSSATSADVIITGLPLVVCSGSGVTLTASSATVVNPVFTWYTDAALSSPVYTGAVYTVPALNANTNYYVTVRGDNKCENAAGTARVVAVTVNPAVSFAGSALPAANPSTAYNVQLNAATGGTPGYTYAVASGSNMPAGLSLSATGIISGTPLTAGNYSFSVTATDSQGCNATAVFSLTVSAAPMSLPPATLPDGIVGTPYLPQTLPAPVGGTGPYTYVATGLPPGLTFNPVTREITGTPTLGGTFTVTVSVTDANGLTAARDYIINVTVPAPAVANAQSCDGSSTTLMVSNPVAGITYRWYAAATGGTALTTGTSFQTSALTTNAVYYAEGTSGTAISTRIAANVLIMDRLTTPVVSKQTSTFNSITFKWTAVAGATAYEISKDNGASWETPSSGPTGTTHLVAGLPTNGTLTLLVRAKGNATCQTSDSGSFTGKANNRDGDDLITDDIYIPNTFTPNGDGSNDIFYAYGNSIGTLTMRIYDQWGHVVFISTQKDYGWDGTYKGQQQPNGVYVYMINAVLKDGTKVLKKGTVTLLK